MKILLVMMIMGALSGISNASASIKQIKCTEQESFDSRMAKEYNGENAEGVLQGAKPNTATGNIGDYTISFDSETKKIVSINVIRNTSGVRALFTGTNAILRSKLRKLADGSFDGDCLECRTHFEKVEGVSPAGDRITINIDDRGVYPDLVASSVSFKIDSKTFDISSDFTTEMSCDGTINLKRPETSTSLEDDLLD